MPGPKIDRDIAAEPVRQLGHRRCGVVIPEVAELFGLGDDAARNLVLALVRGGILVRTDERRRRPDVVEHARGAGGWIYRATRRKEEVRWAGSRSSRRRRRSRAR